DNIPGIPGIGPKTAAELLKLYKTVEGVVAHASELKGKQKERVEQFGEQAILSKKLATIIIDVPVEFNEEALRYTGPQEVLRPILEELEFKTMLPRVFASTNPSSPAVAIKENKQSQLSMFGGVAVTENEGDQKLLEPSTANYKKVETDDQARELID